MDGGAGFDSKLFAEDVANAVSEYCADGVEALEQCLKGAPMLEPQDIAQIQKGIEHLGSDLLQGMESNLSLFEQLCSSTIFSSPADVAWSQDKAAPSPAMARTPGKSEAELDAKLETLRSELRKVGAEAAELRADVARMDQDMRQNGHIVSHTAAFANTLSLPRGGGGDGSSDGGTAAPAMAARVASIAEGVRKLQPLLAKACALRERRAPSAAQIDPSVAVELKAAQLAKMFGTAEDLAALADALGCGKDAMTA